jgi:hypothetical protein
METTSPFKAIQDLQDEQREGWMAEKSDSPETDSCYPITAEFARKLERERNEALQRIDELECRSIHSCHDQCKRPACIKRREKDAAIAELNNRLIEQRQSFAVQLIRIEDGWREKLKDATRDLNIAIGVASDAIALALRGDDEWGDFDSEWLAKCKINLEALTAKRQ